MSPDPFDEIDRALASGLSGLAPETQNGDEKLAAMRPRFQRARTRARVAKVGGAVVGLLAVGSLATLAAPRSGRTHVSVTSRSSTSVPTRTTVRPTTTSVPHSAVTVPGTGKSRTPQPGSKPSVPTTPNTQGTVASTAPGSDNGRGGPGPSSGGGGKQGPGGDRATATTTVPVTGDETQVFQSAGGTITVRLSNHAVLALVSVTPVRGYSDQVRDGGPDRVEVRFTAGEEVKSEIDVRIVNGQMVRTDHS
jgi:hypothetical protein